MKTTTLRIVAAACLVASLGGCAIAGAGAGVANILTQATGSPAPGTSSSAPPTAVNMANAGKPVDKVTVSTNDMVIQEKKTQKVTGTVIYLDGSKDSDIQWASKDSTVVTVNPTTGEISGVKEGTATIYARAASDPDNKFAVINVSVKPGVVEDLAVSIDPADSTIGVGETVQLNATITNSSTNTHANGSWSSSNSQVAYVNDQGLVMGRKAGKATITFQSDQNATVRSSATVTVQ